MAWDTAACLKSLCSAYNNFQQQPCDQSSQDLQRQIDALLGIATHGATLKDFSPKELIYAESLSALVSLINESNLKNSLYLKALMALSQLSNDIETKYCLQTTFNLSSSLVQFLVRQSSKSNKQITFQGLCLLQKMTYNAKLIAPAFYAQEIMKYLIKIIHSSATSDQALYSLYCLANLCRLDAGAQTFIKSMDDVKLLYKKLFSYVSYKNTSYSIASLSLLTSLVLNEEIGEKVFHGHNLANIIQLIFNMLITKEDLLTRQYAADMIIDMMKCQRIAEAVVSNEMCNTYIYRILNLLHSTDPFIAAKVLELVIALCEKDTMRKRLVAVFVKQSIIDEETQLPNETFLSPAQALLHWVTVTQKDDMSILASTLAMVFLRDVLYDVILSGVTNQLSIYISELVPVLAGNVKLDTKIDDEKLLRQKFRKVASSIEVLLSLSKEETLRQKLTEAISLDSLQRMVGELYTSYTDDISRSGSPAKECRDEIVYLIFRMLEMIASLKNNTENGQAIYFSVIQDKRLVPFLAHALSSKTKYLVHASLQIIAEGLKAKEFQMKSLGDTVSSLNQKRENEINSLKYESVNHTNVTVKPVNNPPLKDITNIKTYEHENSVTMAILSEKLTKGLELKDSKVSDIMEFYEHKLASLSGREKSLQDLLDAKTAAVAQSEKLLAQYRCRQAQSDAECLQLRNLLRESERRCENDTVKMEQYIKTKTALEEKVSGLQQQLQILENIANEHKQLTVIFNEQSQKLESLQKSLLASEEEHQSLSAMNDLLQKNIEKMKSKLECSNERIKFMEEEQQKLNEQLRGKDDNILDLKKVLQQAEITISEKNREIETCINQGKNLEKEIKSLEKNLKDTKHKIASLEIVCQQHEQTIKEKEESMASLQEELEKQTQISAMIHNLTSGRMNLSNLPK